jgi:hypothetical protein
MRKPWSTGGCRAKNKQNIIIIIIIIIIITVIVIFAKFFSLKLMAIIEIEIRNIQTYVIRIDKLHTFYISTHWGLLH